MKTLEKLSSKHLAGSITGKEKKEILDAFARHVNAGQVRLLRSGHLDVLEAHREVARFTDPFTGREMYDCFTSAGCFNVGRRNPVMIEALKEALDELDLGTPHLFSEAKLELAEKLVSLAPGDLNRVIFAAGGGEAIDCAIKLARAATGRPGIVATKKAYHGHTGFALSANGKDHYRKYFEPLMPGFSFVPFNDLQAAREAISKDTAAVILEPVQGEAGIFVAAEGYLEGLRKACDEHGALLILDEVQTGFGRTGKMFAAEHWGVVPDVLVLAKSIGAGLFPNAAVLYRGDSPAGKFVDSNPSFHITSTGGSNPGCRVALRVISYIEEEGLCEQAARKGQRLKEALEALMKQNPRIIREVRGLGMMVGLEYLHEFMGPMMSDALAKNGVFAAYSGNAPQVMRFMLPLAASEEDVEKVIAAIESAVREMNTLLPLFLPAAKIPGLLKLMNNEKVQTATFNMLRSAEGLSFKKRRRERRQARS